MRARGWIAWGVVGALALVAFVTALLAVWQPSDSQARSGWGGTAVVCGLTAFFGAIGAAALSEGDE